MYGCDTVGDTELGPTTQHHYTPDEHKYRSNNFRLRTWYVLTRRKFWDKFNFNRYQFKKKEFQARRKPLIGLCFPITKTPSCDFELAVLIGLILVLTLKSGSSRAVLNDQGDDN